MTTESGTLKVKVPTDKQISETLQLFRGELDKNMDLNHHSASPGHDAMTVALRQLFANMQFDISQELKSANARADEAERQRFIQEKSAELLGRLVAEKDEDRLAERTRAEAAEQSLAEVRRDAERYRLWRKCYTSQFALNLPSKVFVWKPSALSVPMLADYEKQIDAAIDAAIQAEKA